MKLVKPGDISPESVSHAPGITKHVMVRKGDVPHLTNFSSANLRPFESVPEHYHEDMYEVFYVQKGCAEFIINGTSIQLDLGACLIVEPGEKHQVKNIGMEELRLIYFGIIS